MGLSRSQQVQPVGLGLGQRLLVPEHHAVGIVLDPPKGNEALALGLLARTRNLPRNLERLGIAVDGWIEILPQNPSGATSERTGGTGITFSA